MSEFQPVVLSLSSQFSPSLAVEVLPSGFITHSILLNDGATNDILQGPFQPAGHAQPAHGYQNTIVGRYANRIPKAPEGGYPIEKNGIKSVVNPTPNETPTVSLHGGPAALDRTTWKPVNPPTSSKLFSAAEIKALKEDFLIFTTTSPAGHNGYPGTLLIESLIKLVDPVKATPGQFLFGQLLIVYRARVLEDGIVTPVNLTQHWGFNLEIGRDAEQDITIKDHNLTIRADNILELDSSALATGKLIPTKGTSHDHANKRIGDSFPPNGYDDFYVFTKEAREAFTKTQPTHIPLSQLSTLDLVTDLLSGTSSAEPLVELSSPKKGLTLAFTSNQSGVQFYSASKQGGAGTRKKIHGGSKDDNGKGYPIYAAAFLEFHEPIASFLHPHNGIDSLLASGELYHNYVKIDFKGTPHHGED